MPVTFANSAGQLINTSGLFGIPVSVPGYVNTSVGNWSMSFWIKANWGTSAAPRGTKSFVGIYGPMSVTAGMMGYYFNNMTLSGMPALQRSDSTVNFNWAGGSPGAGVNSDQFSVRWIGWFTPNVTGVHMFRTISDDGVRLYVNSTLIIDKWVDQSSVTNDSTTNPTLTAGVAVPVVLEYYENGGDAVVQLQYRTNVLAAYGSIPAWNGTFGMSTSKVPTQTMTALQIGAYAGTGDLVGWTYGGASMVSTPANFMAAYNNQWVNIAYTFDGITHIMYLNGVQVATSVNEQLPGTLQYITLNGYYAGGANETDTHTVGNLIVYNRTLSADEIMTLATSYGNRHGDYYGCVARYEFNEGVDQSNASNVLDLIATAPANATNLLMTGAGTAPKYTYDGPADSHRQMPSRT